MASEKETKANSTHTYTKVEQKSGSKEELLARAKKNALPYRIATVILWILALTCEVFAILFFSVKLEWHFLYEEPGHTIAWAVALGLDLVFMVIGSLLWKKSNHLDPAKRSRAFMFWCQNNLGVIVAAVAFLPFIIFALTDKNATKKSKTLAAIAGVVSLVIAALFGIDFNPQSQEEMLDAAGINEVYWTASGTVFHTHDDCGHLKNTVDLLTGTSGAAIENGKTRLCKTCEKRDADVLEAAKDKIAAATTVAGGPSGNVTEAPGFDAETKGDNAATEPAA
ncbi:MAG: hypothetical protein MJ137_07515 [Clostridia bacterium]|nr:hypothetical protein [Clostridia bacterium]